MVLTFSFKFLSDIIHVNSLQEDLIKLFVYNFIAMVKILMHIKGPSKFNGNHYGE